MSWEPWKPVNFEMEFRQTKCTVIWRREDALDERRMIYFILAENSRSKRFVVLGPIKNPPEPPSLPADVVLASGSVTPRLAHRQPVISGKAAGGIMINGMWCERVLYYEKDADVGEIKELVNSFVQMES